MAQNRCIRYITGVNRFERITPILNEAGILNMFARRQFLSLCFLHKLLDSGSASYLNNMFVINFNNTRAGSDSTSLVVRRVRKTQNEHILSHCLSKLWNSLPKTIRCSESHAIFRTAVFKYLIEKQQNGDF